jgi:hypothetical protein
MLKIGRVIVSVAGSLLRGLAGNDFLNVSVTNRSLIRLQKAESPAVCCPAFIPDTSAEYYW